MTPIAAVALSQNFTWARPVVLVAAGELVVDKLPFAPPRTSPPALVVRVLSGAFCARALARDGRTSKLVAMGVGALGALAGTYGGFAARRYLTGTRGWPDFPIAVVEDVLALGLARYAVGTT